MVLMVLMVYPRTVMSTCSHRAPCRRPRLGPPWRCRCRCRRGPSKRRTWPQAAWGRFTERSRGQPSSAVTFMYLRAHGGFAFDQVVAVLERGGQCYSYWKGVGSPLYEASWARSRMLRHLPRPPHTPLLPVTPLVFAAVAAHFWNWQACDWWVWLGRMVWFGCGAAENARQ
jgi:hypothetical protein